MRTAIKTFEATNPSEELFRFASSAIDKAETKGLIHKNKASHDEAHTSCIKKRCIIKKKSIKDFFSSLLPIQMFKVCHCTDIGKFQSSLVLQIVDWYRKLHIPPFDWQGCLIRKLTRNPALTCLIKIRNSLND